MADVPVALREAHVPSQARTGHTPTLRLSQPLFIGIGLADTAALPEVQYGTAIQACRAGSTVETHYYPGHDHGGAVNASLVDSVPFVRSCWRTSASPAIARP